MFWPGQGEALSRTIEAESAISDLYTEALRRWCPGARAAVLPALTASALPPDPAAVAQAQSAWDQHADTVIVAGLGILWALAVYETAVELGGTVGDAVVPDVDTVVLGIVLASLIGLSRKQVLEAVAYVDSTPVLARARADFLTSKREFVAATPSVVRAKVEAALANSTMEVERTPPALDGEVTAPSAPQAPDVAPAPAAEPSIAIEVVPENRPEVLRVRADEVMQAASPEMRDVAKQQGYQAAGVMNHAVLAAAQASAAESGEELQKTWISTLDGKTRPSHWAGDGQRVPLATAFTIGGEQLQFPGDTTASPAEWKNCRCRMGILAVDEELPDEVDRHTERLNGRDSVAINRNGRTQAEEIERRAGAGNVRARDTDDGIGRVASGGWAAPSEQEYEMATEDAETYLTFTDALFAVIGTPTDDRRMLATDIDLTFRDTPLPLQWCEKSKGGHDDSVTIGVIESLSYADGEVRASGYLLNNEHATKAFDLMSHGVANPSVDLGGEFEMFETYDDGTVVTDENFDPSRPIYRTITKAKVMATTIVAIPAFGETRISLNADREARDRALVAAAAENFQSHVKTYDPALFENPQLTRATAPTMNAETGRIYGHLAEWGHTIRGGSEVTPRNRNGYLNFHTSQVMLDDGKQLSVGRLTVQGGHASTAPGVTVATARAHYDNVCTAFGLVRVGEDAHGIWFSGVPAPGVDPETFQMGMTAPLSGDWRDCPGAGLDMIGAHAVNSPGFPIYSAVTGPDGRDVALVASLGPSPRSQPGGDVPTLADFKAIVAEALAESAQAAELARRRDAVLARAFAAVGEPPRPATPTERMAVLIEALPKA
ncbi:hypothetical protein [Mycobacterium sp. DL440]|uniref:hypothetical protein n=1 Tax=Mycobacterium sp. DL440 TaxID=2675523 RepID=UPI001421EDA4|nr:hypothetical protein [Mycobacterium sp. DL440]